MEDVREKKQKYESPRLERMGDIKDLTKKSGGEMPDWVSASAFP
jgi:hypothetical protein